MKLIEKEYGYLIDGVFPSSVMAGFTKTNIEGNLPQDIKKSFSFYKQSGLEISYLNQQHSHRVNFIEQPGVYQGDALFTKKSNSVLMVRTADCLPIFFYSQDKDIVGIAHMGWRGAVNGILNNIDSDLSSYQIAAGVGLRKCCYEVGEEFLNYLSAARFVDKREGRLYFDPIEFAKNSLSKLGMVNCGFFDLNICSFCSRDNFFSYRKTAASSRTVSFIFKR